jgi:adenylate cyclase
VAEPKAARLIGRLRAAEHPRLERRLAAILAADVAGYSRLMSADEEGTHFRLLAYRRDVIAPKVREHRGRIVKHTGDGALVEFGSVVDAVRCALEVQQNIRTRNAGLPQDRRIEFRSRRPAASASQPTPGAMCGGRSPPSSSISARSG